MEKCDHLQRLMLFAGFVLGVHAGDILVTVIKTVINIDLAKVKKSFVIVPGKEVGLEDMLYLVLCVG